MPPPRATAEPLITAADAVTTYAQQLNFLAIVETLVASAAASTLQAEVSSSGGVRGVRASLLYLTLMLELSALVLVVCIGLKAVANFALRAHCAASAKQLLLLTSMLPDAEERLFGWTALVTLAGLVCFGAYGSALMVSGDGVTVTSSAGVAFVSAIGVAHVAGGLLYFYRCAETSPYDQRRRHMLGEARRRAASVFGSSEHGALRTRYGE